MSATALMRAILSNPKSIMARACGRYRRARGRAAARFRQSRLGLGFHVDRARIDRARGADLLGRRGRVVGRGRTVADAVLEALDGTAEIAAHVLELLGAEDQHHDQKDDQPVPDTE